MQKTESTAGASGISGTPIPYDNEIIVLDSDTEDSDGPGRNHDADDSGGGCTGDDMTSTEHLIDEQGDLQLVVTAGPRIRQVFRVDSRALARSSEFWHHLINTSDDGPPTSKDIVEVDTGPQYTFTSLQALLSQPDPPALVPAAEMSTPTRTTGSIFGWPDSPDTSSRPLASQWMSNHQSLGGQMPAGSPSQVPQTSSASPTAPASPFYSMTVSPFASASHNQVDAFSSVAPVPFILPGTPVTTATTTATTTSASGVVSGMSNPLQATEAGRTIHLDLAEYRTHVDCLGTLLYAAHGRLDRVPTQPTLREFCSLVVLANRCDMVPIMRGHIHTWLHTAVMADDDEDDLGGLNGRGKGSGSSSNNGHGRGGGVQSPGIPPGLFTRLRIFWEVGSQTEFQRTLAMLAWHTQMDGNGGLACNQQNSRLPRPVVREEVVAVTGVADNVASHRKRIITLALDLLHRRIQLLQGPMSGSKLPPDQSDGNTITACDANGESCSCAVGKRAGRDCDAYYYGLLVQELGRKRVDPHRLPVPAAVRKSPHALCAILEYVHDAIDERTQPLQSRFLNGHGHCNPLSPMIVQLKSLRDEDTADLTEAQRKHFQEQSLKMGKKYWGM
ncbi:hypothetical protein CMQ_7418 [Grosmannia clavigera kw1407]|uniref:Uncharacterized protein n=1 Tax=Grosmannia clavigera (strain kw1407 / UAMH 11150) TaxID=655863 RepID=F0XP65_GROCL|nr:uncharacterized protein CMQ_7418 [Grosmannia clavigera kw1407]EFX00416.1 hypothetical protein CMQ_7418 [Grosmannia clavigera kw1407]